MAPHAPIIIAAAAPCRFAAPGALLLLVFVPVIALALWLTFVRQRRALAVFAGASIRDSRPSTPRALAKVALTALGCASLILALARPQADPIEEQATVRGRDIAFLVDVSRSMLSRDVVPSRLERAKLWIKDLTKSLRGDRVALVAFAGVPVVECPLTLDYGFFNLALDDLSPASSPRGGTMIGDAIRKSLSEVFDPGVGRYRDIILITDGEDQGSFPEEAAKKAGELGVRIIALGIGSEIGAPVPTKEGNTKSYVEYQGKEVRSKLETTTLAKVTAAAAAARGDASGGVFLNVGTGTIDLDKVYHDLIASAGQRETETAASVVYRELFPYFLTLAGLCLAIEPLIRVRAPIRQGQRLPRVRAIGGPAAATLALLVLAASARAQAPAAQGPAPAPPVASQPAKGGQNSAAPVAPDAGAIYNHGRELFLAGKFTDAAEQFRQADLAARDPDLSQRARFNLGQTLLKEATVDPKADPSQAIPKLDAAARAFKSALELNPRDTEAARNVEIARRLMKDAQDKQEQQQKEQQQKSGKGQQNKDQKQNQQGDQNQQSGQSGKDDQNSQQHQDNADKLKDLARQQSAAADTSKQAQQQQDPAGQQAKTNESLQKQDDVNKGTSDQRQELDQSKDSSKEAQQKLDDAQREQQQASDALKNGDPKTAEEHQRKAAQLLDQASQAEQQAAEQAKAQPQESKDQQAKEQQSPQERAAQEQAAKQAKEEEAKHDQTAAQLLDKERRQREARQQVLRALRGRPAPVQKDW